MITDALLWVSNPALLFQRVAGLTVLERQLHTAARAGLRRVWITAPPPDQATAPRLRLPAGLEAFWVGNDAAARTQCKPPYLVLSGIHFIQTGTIAHIAETPGGLHAAFVDPAGTTAIQVVPCGTDEYSPGQQSHPLPEGAVLPIQHPLDGPATMEWLLARGPKSQDGFMARHFDRYISLTITRALLDTPVSPNMMTVLSCLLGLAGTACFLLHDNAAHLAGAILVWVHSVLDGCDGELARIRFQESPLGGAIDFWGDNLVHVSLFCCLGVGFSRADKSILPLLAGLIATLGIIGSAVLVYRQRLARSRRADEQGGAVTAFSRLETVLEQRDFIYLLPVLAYFGHTYEFLWAGAVGTMLFFMMLIYIGRNNREETFQPSSAP